MVPVVSCQRSRSNCHFQGALQQGAIRVRYSRVNKPGSMQACDPAVAQQPGQQQGAPPLPFWHSLAALRAALPRSPSPHVAPPRAADRSPKSGGQAPLHHDGWTGGEHAQVAGDQIRASEIKVRAHYTSSMLYNNGVLERLSAC